MASLVTTGSLAGCFHLWLPSQLLPSQLLEGASQNAELLPALPNLKLSGSFSFPLGQRASSFSELLGFHRAGSLSSWLIRAFSSLCPLGHLFSFSILISWPSCHRAIAHGHTQAFGILYGILYVEHPAANPVPHPSSLYSFDLSRHGFSGKPSVTTQAKPESFVISCQRMTSLSFNNTNSRYDKLPLVII